MHIYIYSGNISSKTDFLMTGRIFISTCKFKKIRGMNDFSDQFRKNIMRYKRIGYNLNVMRQSACLVINPITIDGYAALFNCTPVDRASDSMMAPT